MRVISEPASYLADLGRDTARGWDRFFFAPSDPTPVGLIRFLLGLVLLWDFGVLGLDLHAFLGSDGWADPDTVRFLRDLPTPSGAAPSLGPSWSFWFLVPDPLLVPAYLACLGVLLLFAAGLWSRLTSALSWAIVVSTAGRSPEIVFGFDQVASMLLLYLAVTGSSGQAVSLDRYLRRWRSIRDELSGRRRAGRPLAGAVEDGTPPPSVSANLCLRLIQLHLCVIYGLAGLAKLQYPIWWEGWAFGSLLGYAEFRPLDLSWLARWPMLLMLLSHGAIFIEVAYPALVWPRALRPLVVALTIGLHVGIAATMGLYEFALGMIVANLAFASGPWLRSLATGRDPEAIRVLFDGDCPRCRASVALGGAADPGRMVDWVDLTAVGVREIHPALTPEACLSSMHAVGPGARLRSGFDAVLGVARRLPLCWPLAVVGSMPGVTWVGRLSYNKVAASRPRDVPCTDETCALPASDGPRGRPASPSKSKSKPAPKARR